MKIIVLFIFGVLLFGCIQESSTQVTSRKITASVSPQSLKPTNTLVSEQQIVSPTLMPSVTRQEQEFGEQLPLLDDDLFNNDLDDALVDLNELE